MYFDSSKIISTPLLVEIIRIIMEGPETCARYWFVQVSEEHCLRFLR